VLSNRDGTRIAGRIGGAQARIVAMLLLTLHGTIYYGDEIGMPQVPVPPDQVRDPFEKRFRGSGSAVMVRGHRCSGTAAPLPAS
jgi:alpha-glucosidase